MKIQTVRKNAEPFGTEYSCMMMMVIKGKLVVVKPDSAEGRQIQKIVLESQRLSPKGVPQEASAADMQFFFNQLRTEGAMRK